LPHAFIDFEPKYFRENFPPLARLTFEKLLELALWQHDRLRECVVCKAQNTGDFVVDLAHTVFQGSSIIVAPEFFQLSVPGAPAPGYARHSIARRADAEIE